VRVDGHLPLRSHVYWLRVVSRQSDVRRSVDVRGLPDLSRLGELLRAPDMRRRSDVRWSCIMREFADL